MTKTERREWVEVDDGYEEVVVSGCTITTLRWRVDKSDWPGEVRVFTRSAAAEQWRREIAEQNWGEDYGDDPMISANVYWNRKYEDGDQECFSVTKHKVED